MKTKTSSILFISWDGPQTSYMEGLFLPIFNEISKKSDYKFYVIQFTWADQHKTESVKKIASACNIKYTALPIQRKPVVTLGSLYTIYSSVSKLKSYIAKHHIDIVMPRSNMPAMMVSRLKLNNLKLVFDADGLPIEERVDFAGLSRKSLVYRFFRKEETKMLRLADAVITRSQKAIDYHLQTIGFSYQNKFSVVFNGRDKGFFKPETDQRIQSRTELDYSENEKVFVYCGSLGPQYGLDEMISILKKWHQQDVNWRFLILTGNVDYAKTHLPEGFSSKTTIKKVAFEKVAYYLNSADVAFAIREPKLSMIGVAPIKLGEYLLMGLPVIASKGIGDSEEILKESKSFHLYDHHDENRVEKAVQFLKTVNDFNKQQIRDLGITYFSLEQSAESYIKALDRL